MAFRCFLGPDRDREPSDDTVPASVLHTALCDRRGSRSPILQAGMGPQSAGQVTEVADAAKQFADTLDKARASLERFRPLAGDRDE